MVEDLTHYLFSNNLLRYIEGYVQKVSPQKAPQVSLVGGADMVKTPYETVEKIKDNCHECKRLKVN